MKHSQFSVNLATYRKKRGLTQESLAKLISVTPQAVSKWEKGGYPDSYLLPKIAEALDVSLDVLFGLRQEEPEPDLTKMVMDELSQISPEKRGAVVMELCYHMLYAYHDNLQTEQVCFPHQLNKETFAHLRTDYELAISRLNSDMQYFCFLRIPENGIDSYTQITPRLISLFQLLSDETALRIVFFAENLPRNYLLTKECISQKLNLSSKKVSEIVERFIWLGIMWELTADLGETAVPIYGYVHNIPLTAILTLATSLTHFIANCKPDIDIWTKGPFRGTPE